MKVAEPEERSQLLTSALQDGGAGIDFLISTLNKDTDLTVRATAYQRLQQAIAETIEPGFKKKMEEAIAQGIPLKRDDILYNVYDIPSKGEPPTALMGSRGSKDFKGMTINHLTAENIDRIVEMAWEDRTPFEAIELQFGLRESQVIEVMRREMKASSFRMWRKRVSGRKTKHLKSRNFVEGRFRSSNQKGS
jgi:uncharacterized protein (TIGR03643 family)